MRCFAGIILARAYFWGCDGLVAPNSGPMASKRNLGPEPRKVASMDEQVLLGAPAAGPADKLAAFADVCRGTAADKRLVDEAVAMMAYSGSLVVEHEDSQTWSGQGAVKRGLDRVLLSQDAAGWTWGQAVSFGNSEASCGLVADRADGQGLAKLEVTAAFDAAGGIERLQIAPRDPDSRLWLQGVVDGSKVNEAGGPKWETFDGRVRQRIWQRHDLFAEGNTFVKDTLELTTGRIIMMVDQTVWGLYSEKFEKWAKSVDLDLEPIVCPGNEDEKTMENMLFLLDELKRVDPLRRAEPALAIGGGVLTDTAGFACALWRRGVPWARLPTTLLGMVDASVGIKVAVNYHRKNGVGHFYSPIHTFVDRAFLPTLEKADIISACGEIMKAALVHDATLFDLMETDGKRLIDRNFVDDPAADEIIKRSVDTMLECIGPDLWEEALLRPMDFGHSFSRTLETSEAFKLRHGEAVAIDCIMNTMIANVQGHVTDAEAQRVLDLYAELGLPCSIRGITADTYKTAAAEITIHRDGILRAPLPKGIGECVYTDAMPDADIEQAFAKLSAFIAAHPETEWDPSKSFSPTD